jgi:hypothetical protein
LKHLGDITKINGYEIEPVDVITGGSPCQDLSIAGNRKGLAGERSGLFMEQMRIIKEMREADRKRGRSGEFVRCRYAVWENVCFAAGTLVTCESGYKPIENVAVGENVKTSCGEYMPVVKTHKHKVGYVLEVSVSGGETLTVTPNHPFLAREKLYMHPGKNRGRSFTDPKWVRADDLTKNHLIAYRVDEPSLPGNFMSDADAWAIGRWLADGSVDLKKSNPRIFISCGNKKVESTRERIYRLPYKIYENRPHESAINFCFTSREFYSLIANAGVGAGNKRVPHFVFSLPIELQRSVLDGYISGDGYMRTRGENTELSATTASRELAYGIARLIRNVYRVSANITVHPPKDCVMNGRILHANYPSYQITASLSHKNSLGFYDREYVWQPVKNICGVVKRINVYNLSVLEENTYAANDVVVHNCGAFSSNKGCDFQAVLTEFVRVAEPDAPDVPMPVKGKWPKSGCVYDNMGGWSVAWRVHDAQFWGVPQRRKRIALVADFNGLTAPEILFDPQYRREAERAEPNETEPDSGDGSRPEVQAQCQSVSGHIESSGTPGEGTAEGTEGSVGGTDRGSGSCGTRGAIADGGTGQIGGAISFQERAGKPGGGKGILIQGERTGALSTLNNQPVLQCGCVQSDGGEE